jgi:two-component system, chemotaxis family, response regulator WspF
MKVALVEASAQGRQAIERALSATDHVISWAAGSGSEAIPKFVENPPELVLLSAAIADMSPARVVRSLLLHGECVIVLLSDGEGSKSAEVYEAMGSGAVDVVVAPSIGRDGKLWGDAALLAKLRTVSKLLGHASSKLKAAPSIAPSGARQPKLVAIGASTGGPQALLTVLSALPKNFRGAIVIVQHVDSEFSEGLASWLTDASGIRVDIAKSGSVPVAGAALLAGTQDHLIMTSAGSFRYTTEPLAMVHRPSVDVLFSSLAEHWRKPGAAVLLTGMGRDGAQGLQKLRRLGWHTVAQDEVSCVVYGMPKAAVQLGAACKVLPPLAIASELSSYVAKG